MKESVRPRPLLGDALGAACTDCWNDGGNLLPTHEVLELSTGEVLVGDVRRYFERESDWSDLGRSLLALVHGDVLDIGVGVGRYSVDLITQPRVTRVVGLDTSAGCLRIARKRGLTALVNENIWDFRAAELFDTLLMTGNNLGLLGSPRVAVSRLRHLAELARPGGILVGWSGLPSALSSDVRRYNKIRRRPDGLLTCRVRYNKLATAWFDYMFFDPAEFRMVVRDSSWKLTRLELEGPSFAAVLVRS